MVVADMTKREFVAAMAMQGLLAWSPHDEGRDISYENVARTAIDHADLLLAELAKSSTPPETLSALRDGSYTHKDSQPISGESSADGSGT